MNGKNILLLSSVCLFLSATCEATCSIGDRTDLDTHLAAYFSDPSATHVCGDISTWDVSNVTDFTDLYRTLYDEVSAYTSDEVSAILCIADAQWKDTNVVDKEINFIALIINLLNLTENTNGKSTTK